MTTFFGKKGKILLLPIVGLFVAPNVAAQNPQAPRRSHGGFRQRTFYRADA